MSYLSRLIVYKFSRRHHVYTSQSRNFTEMSLVENLVVECGIPSVEAEDIYDKELIIDCQVTNFPEAVRY